MIAEFVLRAERKDSSEGKNNAWIVALDQFYKREWGGSLDTSKQLLWQTVKMKCHIKHYFIRIRGGAQWLSGRVLDMRQRGRGF